jgi:hypothetical protein
MSLVLPIGRTQLMPCLADGPSRSAHSGVLAPDRLRSARVLLAGLGNIGSYLAGLLAPLVAFVRLVDRGAVALRNTENQYYGPDCEGQAKVDATAGRIERLAPTLTVERRAADLEDLPWGDFADVDVGLAGLDSLRARQVFAERLYPLGIPLIDGAVGDPLLVRVQVLVPGHACLQCSWGEEYRHLAAEYPCQEGKPADAPRTLSPNCGGAVTAGMMMAQCLRLFGAAPPSESYELHGDLLSGRFLTARRRPTERCRYCRTLRGGVVPVIPLTKPFLEATIADLITAAERATGPRSVRLEFRRGILADSLFGGQLFAEPAQLRHVRHVRLEDFGLTRTDHVVVHASGQPCVTHIACDSLARCRS